MTRRSNFGSSIWWLWRLHNQEIIIGITVIILTLFTVFLFRHYASKFENISDNEPTVIAFVADWCGHCKRLEPELLKAQQIDSTIVKVNSDDPSSQELMKQYGVKGFPTIVRVSDGEVYNGPRKAKDILEFSKE